MPPLLCGGIVDLCRPSDHSVAAVCKRLHRACKVLLFDEDIIRIVCRDGKNPDFFRGKDAGNLGQNPDQRKIQCTNNPEAAPAVITGNRMLRAFRPSAYPTAAAGAYWPAGRGGRSGRISRSSMKHSRRWPLLYIRRGSSGG